MGHNPHDDFKNDNATNSWKNEWNRMMPLKGAASPTFGDQPAPITNTDLTNILTNINSLQNNVGVGIVPIGGIIMWSGSEVPTGWKLCDGSPTPTSLPTPNLIDKFIMGSQISDIGESVGGDSPKTESQVILKPVNLPKHTHSVEAQFDGNIIIDNNGGHTHTYKMDGDGAGGSSFAQGGNVDSGTSDHSGGIYADGVHTHTISGYVSPGYGWDDLVPLNSQPVNIPIKKYYALAFIMRYL